MPIDRMFDDSDDIVAIRFGDVIITGQEALTHLEKEGKYTALLSRAVFRLMYQLDLGDKWACVAKNAPTLFKLNEKTQEFLNQREKNET